MQSQPSRRTWQPHRPAQLTGRVILCVSEVRCRQGHATGVVSVWYQHRRAACEYADIPPKLSRWTTEPNRCLIGTGTVLRPLALGSPRSRDESDRSLRLGAIHASTSTSTSTKTFCWQSVSCRVMAVQPYSLLMGDGCVAVCRVANELMAASLCPLLVSRAPAPQRR
jgi:hypothetical protein